MSDNKIVLRMRRIFCCAGAAFARPDLQAGWEEIERLELINESLEAQVQGAVQREEHLERTIDELERKLADRIDCISAARLALKQTMVNTAKSILDAPPSLPPKPTNKET